MTGDNYLWWQRGIVYQIYPRSFQGSDGDGVGDRPGVTGRLDYPQWLGVDALWLSPIFPSPRANFDDDVADYSRAAGRLIRIMQGAAAPPSGGRRRCRFLSWRSPG